MLTVIKLEIDSNTLIVIDSNTIIIVVGDFNTPLSLMDRSSKMKINKETQALNDTLSKMDLIDIYRTFHTKTTEYTFHKCSWNILQYSSYLGSQIKSC